MQAGKQRGVLPLIRRFNEHSERLLNSAMYVTSAGILTGFAYSFISILCSGVRLRNEDARKEILET